MARNVSFLHNHSVICLTLFRYAFDIIGAVFFGKQFGFMEDRHDHGKYIESVHLASTYPVLTKLSVFVPWHKKVRYATESFKLKFVSIQGSGFGPEEGLDSFPKDISPHLVVLAILDALLMSHPTA